MMLFNMLGNTTPFYDVLTVVRTIAIILCAICALAIIVIVLAMESNPEGGANIITGSNDSFYSQNMASTKEGRLKRVMIVFSISLAVFAIVYFLTFLFIG